MKYFVETRLGEVLEIEVEELGDDRYRVRLASEELEADFADVDHLGQCAVRLGTDSYGASVEERPGQPGGLLVRIAGQCHAFQVLDERERAAGAIAGPAANRAETVKAAMPGIIAGVRVAAGQAVAAGTPLVVLEAMKMQNEIACERDGVVAEVCVKPGQAVAAGTLLVRLEPPPAE